jgi:hypothetical protein
LIGQFAFAAPAQYCDREDMITDNCSEIAPLQAEQDKISYTVPSGSGKMLTNELTGESLPLTELRRRSLRKAYDSWCLKKGESPPIAQGYLSGKHEGLRGTSRGEKIGLVYRDRFL